MIKNIILLFIMVIGLSAFSKKTFKIFKKSNAGSNYLNMQKCLIGKRLKGNIADRANAFIDCKKELRGEDTN